MDCDFEARADTIDELMLKCSEHARAAHGFDEIPPGMVSMVQAAIRDE